ncbi:hypothetical protein KBA27_05800, partial [bacterium]|nr:hypothetical protein [bacterium]
INSLVIDKIKYSFVEDYDRFLMNTESANTYSVFNDKILFPQFCEDKPVDITYYTNNFAKDADGNDIQSMSAENDKPLIPEIFAEPILVYGACMRFKGNPEYTKFNYWYSMYKTALATMRSKIATSANATPTIKLYRG